MTLKYEAELLFDLMKRDGEATPSDVLPYESELKEKYLNQVVGAYPKLQDYLAEWLYYKLYHHIPSDFPVETVTNVTSASFYNVVPYAYKSAILKGDTKFINEYGVEQADKTIFHSCYFEQGTLGGNIGNTSAKEDSTSRIRTINPLSLEIGSYSISVITDYKVYVKIINGANNIGISQVGFDSSISFNITDSSKEKVYIVFRKSDNANITTDEVEKIVSFSTIPELTSLSLVSVKMPVLTTSNEDGTKTNILTVNEEVELRKVGDVQDELNLLTGELTQRIGEITFDGSENWSKHSISADDYFVGIIWTPMENIKASSNVVSDKLIGKFSTKENSVIYFSDRYPIITFHKDSLESMSIESFKKKLSELNPTIQCQLITESVKTVDLSCINEQGESATFRPIEGTMHVNTSSQALPPLLDMSVPVEATTQNLMSFANIEEEE